MMIKFRNSIKFFFSNLNKSNFRTIRERKSIFSNKNMHKSEFHHEKIYSSNFNSESKKLIQIQKKNIKTNLKTNPKAINNFKEIVEKYDNFIFDLDGVLWRGSEILKNTFDAIKILRKTKNKKVFFLTNSNKSTRKSIQNKMNQNGLELENLNIIYSSSYILSKYLRENFPEMKKIYVIGREGLINELNNFNFQIFGGYEDDFKKTTLNDTAKIEINPEIEACVCGFDDEINYFKLFYAMQIINKTDKFFGTNYDKYVNIVGRKVPGTFTIISSLETCTEKKATIVSKPNPSSLDIIFKENNIEKGKNDLSRTLMIGDNMNTDILFANNAGIDSLLVFTGVTNEERFLKINYQDKEFFEKYNISKPTYYSKEIKY